MNRQLEDEFPTIEGEDCHARTLRAVHDWHDRFGFWPSFRDLCWWTGDTNSVAVMQERIRVLVRTGKMEPVVNPRYPRKPIGYKAT